MSDSNALSDHRRLVGELDQRLRAPLMAYFLRRTGDRQDAEDLTQETFTRLVGSSPRFDDNAQVHAYVFRVAANLLRDRGRRRKVRKQEPFAAFSEDVVELISNRIVEGREPERVLIAQESLAEVYKVLRTLEERTRTIFVLHRLEGMKHKEIAALLGLGLSTVEKHCMIAMAAIAARFPGERP